MRGTIHFGGIDGLTEKNEIRKLLGYLPQEFGLYPKVSAEVLLTHLAVLRGITKVSVRKEVVKALLHKTNLYAVRHQNLGGFSGGMKRRFGIAQALLTNPRLLIVDEPTAGLDPLERNRFYNLLCELSEDTVVILSTHIVDDVKELCSNMAIISSGEVILNGAPLKLIYEIKGKVYRKQIVKNQLEDYRSRYKVIAEKLLQGKPTIHILSDIDPGDGFESIRADIEDLYFSHISTHS